MSFFSDVLGFEKFAAKDMWKKIKKDPERLLIGAVDPLSTKMWNKGLGSNYEPLVDQMGGQYGGHTISAFGNDDGGVYKRAREAGIDTKAGGQVHDLAHVLSAFYGGAGLAGIGGGAGGGAAPAQGQGLGLFSNGGQGGMAGVGQGNVGQLMANTGINTGGVGGVGGTGASSSSMLQQMMSQGGLGSMPGMSTGVPPQQQQMPQVQRPDLGAQANAQVGNPNVRPPLAQRMMGGLGRVGEALTPVDPRIASQMDPAYLKQLRQNAIMQMGLGMMGSASRGGGFGEALATGVGLGQAGLGRNIEDVYERGVDERAEKRANDRMALEDARYQQGLGFRQEESDYRKQQNEAEAARWQQQFDADEKWRRVQANAKGSGKDMFRPAAPQEIAAYGLPAGTAAQINMATGQLAVLPGTSGGNITEGERVAANYYGRMKEAEAILDRDFVPSTSQYIAARRLMSGNGLTSTMANNYLDPNAQSYYQAASDWVRAKLRKESGAVISPEEMEQEIKTYFPVPGDSKEVVAQKARARAQAQTGMERMGGRASSEYSKPNAIKTAPRVGDTEDGYVFKGGDPSKPENWEKQ